VRRVPRQAVAVLLSVGTVLAVWSGLGWPPVVLIVEHGLPRTQRPTGRVAVIEGVEFVEISRGYFRMGSDRATNTGELVGRLLGPPSGGPPAVGFPAWGRRPFAFEEMPVRWVRIPHEFWIATTEVTNEEYRRQFPGATPSEDSPRPRGPVVDVTWVDATAWCRQVARKSGVPVRLPREEEWEAACRAGSRDEYCYGDDAVMLSEYAWYAGNSDLGPHEVAMLRPNAWGLFDMHGNVWEWCSDHWTAPGRDPGPSHASRGGGWGDEPRECRAAVRRPGRPYFALGFRPAFSLPAGAESAIEPYLLPADVPGATR
jgi:formylglycine-generating enzyme required for sulfatase activity